MQKFLTYLLRSSVESPQQQTIADLVKSSPTSKLIGKLNMMRGATTDSTSAAAAAGSEGAEEKWDWMTGLPTSVRFLAKSWRPIKRGPGGIVTDPPDSNKARTSITDQDQGPETKQSAFLTSAELPDPADSICTRVDIHHVWGLHMTS